MMLAIVCLVVGASVCSALYDGSTDVVELTQSNFHNRVLNSDEIWIVEFYAPWCGHCKNFAPEYKKAAKALKGLIRVGAVDMTEHQSVGQPYNVQGFPTVKIFGANKQKPTDYQGARTAQGLADAAIEELRRTVSARLGGKTSSGSGSKKSAEGEGKEVIELTDSNFEELVLHSKDAWMVEFFAPWCGHCKALKPHWDQAATELKGKIKLGALDATVHQVMASRFGIKGFPTIKYFAPGSGADDAIDYDGGRSSSDIVQWALNKIAENMPAPEIMEATSQPIVEEACKEKQLCIVSVLPDILDCQSKCRNDYLAVLKELGEKFKKNMWGWIWTEAGKQPELEEAFGMGGFGYPAMAAVNYRKMKFSMLKGSFGKDGINEFLRDLSFGKGQTAPVKGAEFPKIRKVEPWDGKDGVMPVDEEIDISDVELDDLDTSKKTEL
uniref:Protein disulfide-isomerase A6 homolog n=1 Tax=Parascaris univalens TaxID=6257 RepID=A0A915C0J1_PARUN